MDKYQKCKKEMRDKVYELRNKGMECFEDDRKKSCDLESQADGILKAIEIFDKYYK